MAGHDVLDVGASWAVADGRLNLDIVDEQGQLVEVGCWNRWRAEAFLMPTDGPRTVHSGCQRGASRFQYDLNVEFYNGQGLPDLRTDGAAVIPSLAQPGQLVAAQFQVSNVGTTGIDATEVAVFMNDEPSSLGAHFWGGSPSMPYLLVPLLRQKATVSIPMGTADGDYYLIIVADALELVDELDGRRQ